MQGDSWLALWLILQIVTPSSISYSLLAQLPVSREQRATKCGRWDHRVVLKTDCGSWKPHAKAFKFKF